MADELSKVQTPTMSDPVAQSKNEKGQANQIIGLDSSKNVFPYEDSEKRLSEYEYYERLFMGHHFTAFNIKIDDPEWTKTYAQLRYLVVNFAGLISKIVADMLFSEPIVIKVPDGDQDFVDGLWEQNNMDVQCYESALANSYHGDALFKLRLGPRTPVDKVSSVIIEDISPCIYFPKVDPFNVRQLPSEQELAWTFKYNDVSYLRREIHTYGMIENKLYEMRDNKIVAEIDLQSIPPTSMLQPIEKTKVDILLLSHIPNWKAGSRYFGISDYHDLETLFYAINNRMSKVDNILDKHSDPILMVPPGIIDEKGQVKKKALGVIEIGEGEGGKPEYIVWDASLENAFKEIEKIIEFMYLIGETSPDVLGLGQGVSDSGRALKFKLMRTIAKVARKKLYYDRGIKEVIYNAQVLAKAWGIKVNGKTLQGEPVMPEIEWSDGLPIDIHEQLEDEIAAVDAGMTSKKAAIMRLYKVDELAAEEMLKAIEDEKPKVTLPSMNLGDNSFEEKTHKMEKEKMGNMNMENMMGKMGKMNDMSNKK